MMRTKQNQHPVEMAVCSDGKRTISLPGAEEHLAARLGEKIRHVPATRSDLVACVRAAIAAEVYETEQRIDVSVDRLIDELLPSE